MFGNLRKFFSTLVLTAGMIAVAWTWLGRDSIIADGPFIIDSWLEEPHLSVSYIWNLYERRDEWYIDNWSDEQLAAVDTFQFGMRETFKAMGLSDKIATEHDADAWIKLYNVATNAPDGSSDHPPHMNVISFWGEAGRNYDGGINGHFYPSINGQIIPSKTWYAYDSDPTCPEGIRNPDVGAWTQHVDRECNLLWEERVTSSGEIEVRRAEDEPIYTLRNKSISDLDILRDGERIRNVQRIYHNAWSNYPAPYPDGTAKVVWEIRNYEANSLTTETITAKPETGEIVSHEREETPLEQPTPTPVPANQPPAVAIVEPESGRPFLLGRSITIEAEATDEDGDVTLVEFRAGDETLATLTSPPWQWIWENAPIGQHVLTALATDDDAATTNSEPITITVATTPTVALTVQPQLPTIEAGNEFSITIEVDTDQIEVDRIATYLDFNSSILEVVNVEISRILPDVQTNQHDNQAGQIDLLAQTNNGTLQSGKFVFATVRFKALGGEGESVLAFNQTEPRKSGVFRNSINYLNFTKDGQISVQETPGSNVYIPNIQHR